MSIGQQWALVFVIFWFASIWYAYCLGHIRGRVAELREIRYEPTVADYRKGLAEL